MLHPTYEIAGGGHSKAACCETKKFTTALKLQIILLSLLVTCAAALFCLPAKNAYAWSDPEEATIDGVTYWYEIVEEGDYSYSHLDPGTIVIRSILTSESSVVVPEKITDRYVSQIECDSGLGEVDNWDISPSVVSLDVSKCSALVSLNLRGGNIASLDISKNSKLLTLVCSNNKLNKLDVSKNSALVQLECSGNNLTSLDVSKNTALEMLVCHRNNMTSLDVSKNAKLTHLECHENKLTSLDVSKNTKLTGLSCGHNKLNSLDVSKNTALGGLYCEGNNLSSLNVSKNLVLWDLFCSDNDLTSLDVSMLAKLVQLDCSNNELSSLDISHCAALAALDCSNNRIADTSKLLAWFAEHPNLPNNQEGLDSKILPQKVSGNASNAGSTDDNNTPATVTGVWKHNSKGWWYAYSNGTYAKGMKKIGNATYYFDSKGWMKTGWQHATGNSDWYYFNKSGAMKTG